MTNSHADFGSLAEQLRATGVAFESENNVTPQIRASIERVRANDTGMVVLDSTPQHVPELRDLAQDLARDTGLNTVVVRTPHVAIGVSDSMTRAEVEEGQRAMVAQLDPAVGLQDFYAAADGFHVPWALVAALIFVTSALIAASTWWSTGRSSLEG